MLFFLQDSLFIISQLFEFVKCFFKLFSVIFLLPLSTDFAALRDSLFIISYLIAFVKGFSQIQQLAQSAGLSMRFYTHFAHYPREIIPRIMSINIYIFAPPACLIAASRLLRRILTAPRLLISSILS